MSPYFSQKKRSSIFSEKHEACTTRRKMKYYDIGEYFVQLHAMFWATLFYFLTYGGNCIEVT